MGVRGLLGRIAADAAPRVFIAAGSTSMDRVRALRAAGDIRTTLTPRAANILVITGDLDPSLIAPALVAHDALAPPRATLTWRVDTRSDLLHTNFPHAVDVAEEALVDEIVRVHRELMTGQRVGDPALLPDVEPNPWRGIGAYGQGGSAMTAGTPYGRPMAGRAEDRDGLKLDYLPVRIGPLFPGFPPGLMLDVKLSGDVILDATLENLTEAPAMRDSIFDRGLRAPVRIRDLEIARARSHLLWLTDAVAVAGSRSLSVRIARLAEAVVPGDGASIRALERTLRRCGFLRWSTRDVGRISMDHLHGVTGPVARASGGAADARARDSAYAKLGFEVVHHHEADVAARWLQRLREAEQAVDLAARAGEATTDGPDSVESPRRTLTGPESGRALTDLIPSLVQGMEWGDAVTTIVSLDLDMGDALVPIEHGPLL